MDTLINQYIPSQFPSFYNGPEGNTYVSFVKAYYEFLEQSNNVIYHSRNLQNYNDIDQTPDEFLQYFKDQYLGSLPADIMVNERLLIKHIQDLWRATGTKKGYELLFRILFNEDIEFYYPGQNLFKPSNNTWVENGYIEVSDNPYLPQLIGTTIYSASTGSNAVVEDFNVITVNNKIINVLILSKINGSFKYGDYILSESISELIISNSPRVTGSLSAVSIIEGGGQFNVGDIVNIAGSGTSGLGRVSSVISQNGKVIFNFVDGGDGFTLNPQTQVTGGGGTGATFAVGSIIDQKVYLINLDVINDYYNTQLDNASEGFTLNISNATGSFTVGETVNSTANGIELDFSYISGNNLTQFEYLSNTTLGISNLQVILVDNPNYVRLTGPQAQLTNANLVSGIILNGSLSSIKINCVIPVMMYNANATITFANSSVLLVNNPNGYFLTTANVHGQTSLKTAYINSVVRDTNWLFPVGVNTNFDSTISQVLTYETLVAGKISSLTRENPGDLYSSNPIVSIQEPLIYQLEIPDGRGGFLGGDANVAAIANNLSGIATSIQVIESGYGFDPGDPLAIYGNGQIYATGTAVVDGTGITQGYWKNNQSFPSDTTYIQDSFYYQTFAYEILAPRMLNTYEKFVTDIVHPVQMKLFGRLLIRDVQNANTQLISS